MDFEDDVLVYHCLSCGWILDYNLREKYGNASVYIIEHISIYAYMKREKKLIKEFSNEK